MCSATVTIILILEPGKLGFKEVKWFACCHILVPQVGSEWVVMSRQRAAITRYCLVTGVGAKGAVGCGILRRGRRRADSWAEEQELDKNSSLILQRQHYIYSAPYCSSSTAEIHTLTLKALTPILRFDFAFQRVILFCSFVLFLQRK